VRGALSLHISRSAASYTFPEKGIVAAGGRARSHLSGLPHEDGRVHALPLRSKGEKGDLSLSLTASASFGGEVGSARGTRGRHRPWEIYGGQTKGRGLKREGEERRGE